MDAIFFRVEEFSNRIALRSDTILLDCLLVVICKAIKMMGYWRKGSTSTSIPPTFTTRHDNKIGGINFGAVSYERNIQIIFIAGRSIKSVAVTVWKTFFFCSWKLALSNCVIVLTASVVVSKEINRKGYKKRPTLIYICVCVCVYLKSIQYWV